MSPTFAPLIPVNTASPEAIAVRKAIQAEQERFTDVTPRWNELPGGAAAYRRMQREGTSGFPKPVLDPRATDLQVKMRDGVSIVLRKFEPNGKPRGTMIHIHGGIISSYL